VGEISYVQSN